MKKWTIILFLALLLQGTAEDVPRLSVALDFLDNAFFCEGDFYSREQLRSRMKLAADSGIRKVYFRAAQGRAFYPSQVLAPYQGEGREISRNLVRSIQAYDVLDEFIRTAHEFGMELYYWEPVFDAEVTPMSHGAYSRDGLKYGQYPLKDPLYTEKPYLQWKHRLGDRLARPELKAPIGRIRLTVTNQPSITAENLRILTADPDGAFQDYVAPFTVNTTLRPDGGAVIEISGLSIDKPCIKLHNRREKGAFNAVIDLSRECVELFYTDGEPVELLSSYELMFLPDRDLANNTRGASGMPIAWNGNQQRSLIIRAGLIDKYAGGLPCYAYRENRERRLAVARELLARYPELDGICYSLRSHSLPGGGSVDKVGKLCYEFNDPIVDEYMARHGINILTEPYDEKELLRIRGGFFTQLLREASEVIHANNRKFEVMAPVAADVPQNHDGSMYHLWAGYSIDDYFEVRKWIAEGLIDNLIMLGTNEGPRFEWNARWDEEVKKFRTLIGSAPVKLTLLHISNAKDAENLERNLPKILANRDLDEVILYEEHQLYEKNQFPVVRRCLEQTVGLGNTDTELREQP